MGAERSPAASDPAGRKRRTAFDLKRQRPRGGAPANCSAGLVRCPIRFQYSCFDRMLLNAVVQPMQQPARVVGFLDKCRQVPSITKAYFRSVSEDYHRFVARLAATQHVQIVEPPKGVRREDWVDPFY